MKAAVAIIIALLVLVVPSALAQTTNAAPKLVHLAVTTAAVRESDEHRNDVLLLWNRNERTLPIGHAVKSCLKAGSGGILGGGVMSCTLVLVLPLGKVAATGLVHNVRRYTLVITGGTGVYEGVTGPLFVRSLSGNGVRRLTFTV